MSQTKAQLISDLVQALNFTGTASAPANGLFLSASNQLKLATASTERLKIDGTELVVNDTGASVDFRVEGDTEANLLFVDASTDRVGIGTASPTGDLEISGSLGLIVGNASGSGKLFADGGSTKVGSKTNHRLDLLTNNTERISIDTSGNVGIGTTSPNSFSNYKTLTIRGGTSGSGIDLELSSGDIHGRFFGDANGVQIQSAQAGDYIRFETAGANERMRIDASGNVDIGTTVTRAGLAVALGGNTVPSAGSTDGAAVFGNALGDAAYGLVCGATSSGHGYIQAQRTDGTASTYDLFLQPNGGNVGIGTTSPTKPSSSNTNTRFMEISSADGADLILGNSATSVSVGDHIGALAFKNVDSNPDSGVPHYAGIRCESANTSGSMDLRFYVGRGNLESDATNMIISAAGNVGIGTSSPDVNFHVSGTSSVAKIESTASATSARLIIKSETDTYTGLHFGDTGDDDVGRIRYYHTDNHMHFSTGASERMRIDSSGNVGIGTTSAVNNSGYGGITLNGGSGAIFSFKDSDVEKTRLALVANDTFSIQSPPGGSGVFRIDQLTADGSGNVTGATERLRIVSGGRLFVGTTAAININGVTTGHTFNQVDDYKWTVGVRCELTNKVGLAIRYAAGGNDHDAILFVKDSTVRFRVNSAGDTANANNSYGSVSDVSLKENIVDASSQWNDIKNLKVRNFNFKSETGLFTHTMMGVVAQEVEVVSPKLVYENEEGLKEVRYSVLYMKSVKALQEAMARIETLEAKVAALEGS